METEVFEFPQNEKQMLDPDAVTDKQTKRAEETRIKKIKELVENLDSNYSKALNLELTKN